jgi:molybdopterin converting factor small subunit
VTRVRIPPVLRESAGGQKEVELEGSTVGDVLGALVERFPALREQLFGADGELNRFVNVYLNDEDVRYLSDLETPAAEHDTIVVLPAMAGGAPLDAGGPAPGRRVGAVGARSLPASSPGSRIQDPARPVAASGAIREAARAWRPSAEAAYGLGPALRATLTLPGMLGGKRAAG